MIDINIVINKSEKDGEERFSVLITGVCEGEPYSWAVPGLFSDAEWAAAERYKISEFKRMVLTQFE